MKKVLLILVSLVLILTFSSSYSEYDLSSYPLVFSNEFADIYFDSIVIKKDQMQVYCICSNKTDYDLSFRMKRFLANGWDVISDSVFDGFFRVSANSKKRDCFEFDHAVSVSGISDPETIAYIDFTLELKSWTGSKVFFDQTDYTHYDIVESTSIPE